MSIKANLLMDQGASYRASINIEDENGVVVPLTGYTAIAQIRKYFTSSIAYSFTVEIDQPNGIITLIMTKAQTSLIKAGRYVFDCLVTDPSNFSTRLIEGIIDIRPGVSR